MNFKEFAKEIRTNVKQKAVALCEKEMKGKEKDEDTISILACKVGVLNGLNEVLDNPKIKEHFNAG